MKDAVEKVGYCRKVDVSYEGLLLSSIKIEIKFGYKNKKIKKVSTAKVFGGKIGYLSTFNKYADRQVKILYSPTFGEVFILKDK